MLLNEAIKDSQVGSLSCQCLLLSCGHFALLVSMFFFPTDNKPI